MRNKETIERLAPCALVRFSKKTGKIDTTLTATGYAMLNLWGLQNTTKGKESIVFSRDNGLMISHYIGRTDGDMPEVEWCEDYENIEEYAEGILESINEE